MFSSCASLYGPHALGVVLSGMGRDGADGAARIVAAGGTILAQDAASSAVWGMPGAVAAAGLASAVLPPDQIAARIVASMGARMIDQSENALGIVAGLLEARTGQKLTADRLWRVGTALAGVLRQNELESLEELVDRLGRPNQAALAQQVVEALLNNETYFFRDRAMFDQLAVTVLPELARKRERTRRLSIWSVGCSTGQEAYSLAMLFAEQPARWRDWTIDIVGTDVARSVIDGAREGNFSQFQIQRGLGVAQMVRFFEETRTGWRANEALRQMVRFEPHNLLDQPPEPGRFDLILCRNVLLYFDRADARARLRAARLGARARRAGHARRGRDDRRPDRRAGAREGRHRLPSPGDRHAGAGGRGAAAPRRGGSGSPDQGKSGVTEP